MEFYIYRTSDFFHNKKRPCEESYEKVEEYDEENDRHKYYVKIDTLEELINFVKKQGETYHEIIMGCDIGKPPYLEIYDGYRE